MSSLVVNIFFILSIAAVAAGLARLGVLLALVKPCPAVLLVVWESFVRSPVTACKVFLSVSRICLSVSSISFVVVDISVSFSRIYFVVANI
ncbi:hypothetical protein [Brucella intermedia]|uniref:hypothetical protein n=1 Tax=Brucella intermedia TaxID=94625 RepID=UPI00124EF4EC|nr:hypothetical protein [Brucella intermedia]KAB2716202.1 hypothetical protein F9K75_16150 [Brucella intermedia]